MHNDFLDKLPTVAERSYNTKLHLKVLTAHISRVNTARPSNRDKISLSSSSYYYFYRYASLNHAFTPCLIDERPEDQSNVYAKQELPFVLRSKDSIKVRRYKVLLSCGASVDLNHFVSRPKRSPLS
jgi:hypothetical protein